MWIDELVHGRLVEPLRGLKLVRAEGRPKEKAEDKAEVKPEEKQDPDKDAGSGR